MHALRDNKEMTVTLFRRSEVRYMMMLLADERTVYIQTTLTD
jgi:hypothetical protein